MTDQSYKPEDVLDFWFPENGHWEDVETHRAFWEERMRGGMDEAIIRDYEGLTVAAARGELDHWAETPRGRLALLIALDQFPRSLWRDTPAAFGQDIKSCRLALEALENGHYEALKNTWERQFFIVAISHCEGPDHMARMDLCLELSKKQPDIAPESLLPMMDRPVQQAERVRGIIQRFGRHPHRNPIYGRVSSPEEEAYIAEGDFPHQSAIEIKTG
ncbi:MAG: DUF924 domain-containing protein [Rhodobacteraceae bacterium]|nr:DUF924 domain-containing protein [Paracoccaceae bacterium]